MERETSQSSGDQPAHYVWHPAIEAILWVTHWTLFALSTGVVWEFVVNGSLRADRVFARGVVAGLALVLLTIVVFLSDFFGGIAQHEWDNYPAPGKMIAVAATLFVAVSTPYVWFVVWLLKRAWLHILPWFEAIPWSTTTGGVGSSNVRTYIALIAISAALLWFAYSRWHRDPFYPYRHALRVLGFRKCIAGVCLMAHLRLLVPRRDFFMHAPVVSWIPWLAGAILAHEVIPIGVFAVSIPILIVTIMIPMWIGTLAPPLWILLGTSEFDAFRMFYKLRDTWHLHGLTLLDRTGGGGRQFYDAWFSSIRAPLRLYDPGIGRIWSLRTRPQLWCTAVRLLAAFVPVIVVDWRQPSEIVQWEVQWLEGRRFLNKLYMVVSAERARTTEQSTTGAKLVDEETLIASQWDDGGLLVFTKHLN